MSDIRITETRDVETVWSIITNREVFNRVCDDSWLAKPLDELKAIVRGMVENPANHIPLVLIDGQPSGCFIAYALGNGVAEIHTFLLCHGAQAIAAGREAMRFVFSFPDVTKLVSMCPACLPEAYWFARRCGWKSAGVSPVKWVKNGIEHIVQLVEIKKEDMCPLL